ncbi:MAG: hypothetical protein JF607_01250 [Burkholderiales bacterium]|nr:hypothetical protein [Burkholderiales bacterium]
MAEPAQGTLLSPLTDVAAMRILLGDLHDDLMGKVARFHQLAELSESLGPSGTMLPGGETTFAAWSEARSSFVHGNFVATVLLCQSLAEHTLAAHLSLGLYAEELPARITFQETLNRCIAKSEITAADAVDLRRLMALRNPLSHYRSVDDPSNLSRRALDSRIPTQAHLLNDATFAISMAIRILSLPAFRLGD